MMQPPFPTILPFVDRELVQPLHLNQLRSALRYLKGLAIGADPGILLDAALRFFNISTAERDLLVPTPGLCVYNTDTNRVETWNGISWQATAGGLIDAITAVIADEGLIGGGSQGDIHIAVGPSVARALELNSARVLWAERSALANIEDGAIAVTTALSLNVEPLGWGASNLLLHFPRALPLSTAGDSRLATLRPIMSKLVVGSSVRISDLVDSENNYANFAVNALPVATAYGWLIPIGSAVLTGFLTSARFKVDFNTDTPRVIASALLQDPGDLVASAGDPATMSIVLLDGSMLRAAPVGSIVPSGGSSHDHVPGADLPLLVLADFTIPPLVSPVPTGNLLSTVTIPIPADAALYPGVTLSANRSYMLLPSSPPTGYGTIVVRHEVPGTSPVEQIFGWVTLGSSGNNMYFGDTIAGAVFARQISTADTLGLGFRLAGRAVVDRVDPADQSTWTYTYEGDDIAFPVGSRIQVFALPLGISQGRPGPPGPPSSGTDIEVVTGDVVESVDKSTINVVRLLTGSLANVIGSLTFETAVIKRVRYEEWSAPINFVFNDVYLGSDPNPVPENTVALWFNLGSASSAAISARAGQWHRMTIARFLENEPVAIGTSISRLTGQMYRDFIDTNINTASGVTGRDYFVGRTPDNKPIIAGRNTAEDATPFTIQYEIHEDVQVVTGITPTSVDVVADVTAEYADVLGDIATHLVEVVLSAIARPVQP